MMSPKIDISFLESMHVLGKDNNIRGVKSAIIDTGKEVRIGRVIEPREMKQAQHVEAKLFETQLDLVDQTVDLSKILQKDKSGSDWLSGFNAYFQEEVPMMFQVQTLRFESVAPLKITKFPHDYFKRENGYMAPEGVLEHLPDNLQYAVIRPPMKFANGKWIPNIYYNRRAAHPNGLVEEISLQYPGDESGLSPVGVLLGKLNEEDIESKTAEFGGGFPLTCFLEVSYPITIRQIGRYNPRSIRVNLSS